MTLDDARTLLRALLAVVGSEDVSFEGLTFRVAGPRLLVRMKMDTVRPQDRLDAERIREAFGLEEP